jgi:hypothetical protein
VSACCCTWLSRSASYGDPPRSKGLPGDNVLLGGVLCFGAQVSLHIQIWRVAANILNNQSLTADEGDFPACGLSEGLKTPHPK